VTQVREQVTVLLTTDHETASKGVAMSRTRQSPLPSRRVGASVFLGLGVGGFLAVGTLAPTAALAARSHGAAARPAASSSSYAGCEITGTAKFTPGLTTTSRTVKYSFTGKFTNCHGSNSKITSGVVKASGKGREACTSGTTTGLATVKWNNRQTSTIKISTTGVGNAVQVSGTVEKGPFKGDSASAVLGFTANPTACRGAGVKSAPFSGAGVIE
jgi:hypothetical protein